MKKFLVLALSALALMVTPQLRSQSFSKITFNMTNPNTGPVCGGTVLTSCVKAMTITDTTASVVVSSTIAPSATSFIYTPAAGTLIFGYSHTFSLVITGVDANGTTITTSPLLATVTDNGLLPPTAFGATLTP